LISDNSYRRRIARFIDGLQAARVSAEPRHGLFDVAFTSMQAMQAMQDTISQLRLSAYAPGLPVEIPRNACGFFQFWRAEELIELGRERTAQAFARIER
jgi:NTE family protein